MNKTIIKVPKGIRYLSDWKEFSLPDHPCIIDKKLTGCGFTEYVIREPFNAVLISPRKTLLENKVDQHNPMKKVNINGEEVEVEIPEQRVIYYARTDGKSEIGVDKDLESKSPKISKEDIDTVDYIKFVEDLNKAIDYFQLYGKWIKICVTYDSFRKVKEVLEKRGILNTFSFIVDECQSVFTDSRFKANTELEFVTVLQDLQKVSFVSATPMIEEYLDLIDEFKNLPYYELDWESEDPGRIITPEIIAKPCKSINTVAKKIISDFKNGKFIKKALLDNYGNPIQVVESRELIFYVNSIKNICDIIRQNKLMPEEVNIICAKTEENKKKIREAFKVVFQSVNKDLSQLPSINKVISKVPSPDKQTGKVYNKPITLCSKTVYLGADFYSECARSIVLSDSGIESLAVDITLDLPQIMGRQRVLSNPWKNSLEIWFRLGINKISQEEYEERRQEKIRKTESLLLSYDSSPTSISKYDLAKEYEKIAKTENYRDHYVAVNKHAGSVPVPQKNNLVMIAEKRAYDIQTLDYKDRFSVFSTIENVFGRNTIDISLDLQIFLEYLDQFSYFHEKIKAICYKLEACPDLADQIISIIPDNFKLYIQTLGTKFIISVGGRKSELDKSLNSRKTNKINSKEEIYNTIVSEFLVGNKYTKSYIKLKLSELYDNLGISQKPKASDLEKWFEVKSVSIYDSSTNKRNAGFEIIKQK